MDKKSLKIGDLVLGDKSTWVVEEIGEKSTTLVDRSSGMVIDVDLKDLTPSNIKVWVTN